MKIERRTDSGKGEKLTGHTSNTEKNSTSAQAERLEKAGVLQVCLKRAELTDQRISSSASSNFSPEKERKEKRASGCDIGATSLKSS